MNTQTENDVTTSIEQCNIDLVNKIKTYKIELPVWNGIVSDESDNEPK